MQKCFSKSAKLFSLFTISLVLSACVTERLVPETSDDNQRANNSADRAVSYMNLKQLKTAEDILKSALKESPKHSTLNYTYAILKLRLGEGDKADKLFRNAVNADPKNSRAAHDYGFYLCSQNRKKEGIKMFERAISNPLFKERSLSSLRAGECIFKQDKGAAERYFSTAYQENPNLSIALFRLAELNFTQNKLLKARAYYQRYAAVQKDTSASLYLAYQIEQSSGSQLEASELKRRLLKNFPGSTEAKQVRKIIKQ